MGKINWPVKWTSKTNYVDIDTGEQLTRYNAKTNYKTIQTHKHAKFTNATKTQGFIEYTKLCRHKRQGQLPFA